MIGTYRRGNHWWWGVDDRRDGWCIDDRTWHDANADASSDGDTASVVMMEVLEVDLVHAHVAADCERVDVVWRFAVMEVRDVVAVHVDLEMEEVFTRLFPKKGTFLHMHAALGRSPTGTKQLDGDTQFGELPNIKHCPQLSLLVMLRNSYRSISLLYMRFYMRLLGLYALEFHCLTLVNVSFDLPNSDHDGSRCACGSADHSGSGCDGAPRIPS